MDNNNNTPTNRQQSTRVAHERSAPVVGGAPSGGSRARTERVWAWRVELQNRIDGVHFFEHDEQADRFADAAPEDAMIEETRMPDGPYRIDRFVAEMMNAEEIAFSAR